MLDKQTLPYLERAKNLLAFSAGVDSTALFFLLLEAQIPFDCAIVNYHTRTSSNDEVAYAQELASRFNKQLFVHDAHLTHTAYEQQARSIRYTFFKSLIAQHHYENLLTAHQLNDQLEWFLMQLTKGAGTLELLGMHPVTIKDAYTLIRPLLHCSKEQLQSYLDSHHIQYFIDESNQDPKHLRNHFRHQFSDPLLKAYSKGIQKSFEYMHNDHATFLASSSVRMVKELCIIEAPTLRVRLFHADKYFKEHYGLVLSALERQEIEHNPSVVISHRYVVEQRNEKLYIAPYVQDPMPKSSKEEFRKADVPLKLRPYLYVAKLDWENIE